MTYINSKYKKMNGSSHRQKYINRNYKNNKVTVTDQILANKTKQMHYILYLILSINYLLLVDIMTSRFSQEKEKCFLCVFFLIGIHSMQG